MEVSSKHSSPFAFLVSGLGSDCVDRRHRRHGGWQRGEPAEGAAKRSTLLPMVEGEAWSIEERGTFTVHCDSGTLWVTAPTHGMDIILSGGEQRELSARGKILVFAMRKSAVWLPPGFIVEDQGRSASRRIVARRDR